MNIMFCLGGEGRRFQESGYTVPKPMIRLGGKALISWARETYVGFRNATPIYICRAQDIDRGIIEHLVGGVMVHIDRPTRGPAETILECGLSVGNEELLIADCDSFFENPAELVWAIAEFRRRQADGGVTIRQTEDPECSYAALNEKWVTQTAERARLSEWSTTGPYYWKDGARFLHYAKQAVAEGVFSIAPIYNRLLRDGGTVRAFPVTTFVHLGRPHDLETYAHDRGLVVQGGPVAPGVPGIS